MKKLILFAVVLISTEVLNAQGRYPVIPYPNKLVEAVGEFEFKTSLSIDIPDVFKGETEILASIFIEEFYTNLTPSKNGKLVFRLNSTLGKESYNLTVNKDNIFVEVSCGTGCFYAFQTIRQLIKLTGNGSYQIPACQIEDKPAFAWRAYMLDEGRNFQGKEVVKKLLDQMGLLKMNRGADWVDCSAGSAR